MSMKPVSRSEECYLRALYVSADGSIYAHRKIQDIVKKVKNKNVKYAKKQLESLKSKGYVVRSSHGGEQRYQLTRNGSDWVFCQ